MRPWYPQQGVVLSFLLVSMVLSGCDNEVFAPPPRGLKTSKALAPTASSRAKDIVLILPAEENDDLQVIENMTRLEVGNSRAAFILHRVSEAEPASKQAELIKLAAAEGASAILLVANKAPETAEAIAAVDQRKTPIILLGRTPVVTKGEPCTLITWPSFVPSARAIVDAIIEDVKKAGYPDDAPVLLLTNDPPDETSRARDAALIDALKTTRHPIAAKVPMVEDSVSSKALNEALKVHPKVCAAISDDGIGISIATSVRLDLKGAIHYMIGGYCQTAATMKLVAMNHVTILVDRNLEGLVRSAVSAAIDRSDGKAVPERIEIEMPSRRASGTTAAPSPMSK